MNESLKMKKLDPAIFTDEENEVLYKYFILGDDSVKDTQIFQNLIESGVLYY